MMMKKSLHRFTAIGALGAVAATMMFAMSSFAAEPGADYAAAKALADRDEASLDAAQRQAFMQSQSRQLEASVANCASPTPDLAPLVVVVEVDARGRIVRTWRHGTSALAQCVEQELMGRFLEPPPRAPFHAAFELSFTR